jgi:hypothetical protein
VYSVKCCCGWPAGAKEYRPIGIVINIKALRAASGWSGAVAAWRLDVWTAVDPKLDIFLLLFVCCMLSLHSSPKFYLLFLSFFIDPPLLVKVETILSETAWMAYWSGLCLGIGYFAKHPTNFFFEYCRQYS